jgi:4'-phosphopantetheinyl transferase
VTRPAEDEVHVWIATVVDDQTHQQARRIARAVLAHSLGVEVDQIILTTTDNGKPALPDAELEFNISHSGDLALIAVATRTVGVDVEFVEEIERDELLETASYVLSDREHEELARMPEADRLLAYYRAWVRKEAYVKATGEGITRRPLPEIELADGPRGPRFRAVAGVSPDELAGWTLADLSPALGYLGAVAVAHPRARVTLRIWSGQP